MENPNHFPPTLLNLINNKFIEAREYIPSDITKPRSLAHLSMWKATELRLVGMYVGYFVLDTFLIYVNKDLLILFRQLAIIGRIPCHPHWCYQMNEFCLDLVCQSCFYLGPVRFFSIGKDVVFVIK